MLRLENITKYYYSSASVTCALRKINLELKIGEFVAITGESGSGKTTLLNLISGQDSYEDGELYYYDKQTSYFDDEDWEKYRKNEIAFIFQNYNLIDSYTVLENVAVTYIIEGYSYKEAKMKAKEVLKKVGLENDLHKKATKLSGGQKQRLSIARALAKETNIIVADEPTGNLDSENGKMILELLKNLSKDKLVIVVTHNLAEIEPFITRKIRLHDGEIVQDEIVEKVEVEEAVYDETKNIEKSNKTIFNFFFLNLKSQPKKVLLLLLLTIICSLSTFVFLANFKTNIDDHKTKKVTDSIFTNLDDKRLLVKKYDDSIISDEDRNNAKVKYVTSVEKYDYITDINYFRPSDYKTRYLGGMNDSPLGNNDFIDSSFIELVDYSHFMRSSSSLDESMLKCGRLPNDICEMVVYSSDESILGTEELVLFRNSKQWGLDSWYQYRVKIVGVLKEPTEQAYFSDDICKVLDLSSIMFNIKVLYKPTSTGSAKRLIFNKIVIDPNIGDYDISFGQPTLNTLKQCPIIIEKNNVTILKQGESEVNGQALSYKMNLENALSVSKDAIGLSKENFEEIYAEIKDKTQFAVYIEDYAYTTDVRNELKSLEYEAISCYQVSVTGYDQNKVTVRIVNLAVSLVGIIVMNVLTVIIAFSILRVKKNDYIIFKMIGLSNSLSKKINYVELIFYGLISTIFVVIIANIVKNVTNVAVLLEAFKYIRWYDYLIVGGLTLISMLMLGRSFGKFITKNAKVTVLKED